MITCPICPGSALTLPSLELRAVISSTSSLITRRSIFSISATEAFKSSILGGQHLPAAEGQELVGQRGGTSRGFPDLLDLSALQVGEVRVIAQQKLGVTNDDHEHVC